MALPVGDIKDVFSFGSDALRSREEPVRVAIFVDEQAPQHLVDLAKTHLFPKLASGMIHVSSFSAAHEVTLNAMTDVAFIVTGTSGEAARLLNRCARHDIPACIVCEDRTMLVHDALRMGESLSEESLVCGQDEGEILEGMARFVLESCHDKSLAFAANFPFVRKALANKIVSDTARQNAVVGGVVIIPGADMPVMTANQAKMILQIAAAYGMELGFARIKELLVAVSGGFALRTVARQALAVVPGFGWAIKAGIGYAGTVAMGKAVIEYFEAGGTLTGVADKLKSLKKGTSDLSQDSSYRLGNLVGKARAKLREKKDAVNDRRSSRDGSRQEPRLPSALPAVGEVDKVVAGQDVVAHPDHVVIVKPVFTNGQKPE